MAENYQLAAFAKEGNVLKVDMLDPGNFKGREAIDFIARRKNLLKAKKLSDKRNKTAKDNPACGLYWDALWSSCHGIYYDSHIANWLKEVERKRKIDFDSLVRTKVLQDN